MLELLLELFDLEEGAQEGDASVNGESLDAVDPTDAIDVARTEGS